MTVQRRDERAAAVWAIAVSFALIVLVSIGVAVWCGTSSGRPPLQGPEVRALVEAFPRPRLQDEPRVELQVLQRSRQSLLEQWAWLDGRHERCRVPVEVAVDALLARGFELDR
jgi:hypothetical protein